MHQFLPVREDVVEKVGSSWETNPDTCISNVLPQGRFACHIIIEPLESVINPTK